MAPFHACEMIQIIMLRNKELGSELHDLVVKKMLLLDDHLILKEAQSWLERKATSNLGSRHQSASNTSTFRRSSSYQWGSFRSDCYDPRYSRFGSGNDRFQKCEEERGRNSERSPRATVLHILHLCQVLKNNSASCYCFLPGIYVPGCKPVCPTGSKPVHWPCARCSKK